MSALDDGLDAITTWGTSWQKNDIQDAARSELADLRASLAAAQARVAELMAELAAYGNAEPPNSEPVTLTPRKCRPDCYRKGWKAAIEAAADVCYNFLAKYPLSPKETAAVCGDNIRALEPPADCGGACNPLEPDADEFDGIMCQCSCGCSSQATRYVDGMPSCEGCYQA